MTKEEIKLAVKEAFFELLKEVKVAVTERYSSPDWRQTWLVFYLEEVKNHISNKEVIAECMLFDKYEPMQNE